MGQDVRQAGVELVGELGQRAQEGQFLGAQQGDIRGRDLGVVGQVYGDVDCQGVLVVY